MGLKSLSNTAVVYRSGTGGRIPSSGNSPSCDTDTTTLRTVLRSLRSFHEPMKANILLWCPIQTVRSSLPIGRSPFQSIHPVSLLDSTLPHRPCRLGSQIERLVPVLASVEGADQPVLCLEFCAQASGVV